MLHEAIHAVSEVAEFKAQKIDGGLWITRANNRVCM
jgi:hypothetical protein